MKNNTIASELMGLSEMHESEGWRGALVSSIKEAKGLAIAKNVPGVHYNSGMCIAESLL